MIYIYICVDLPKVFGIAGDDGACQQRGAHGEALFSSRGGPPSDVGR